jgi:hypothetical protein
MIFTMKTSDVALDLRASLTPWNHLAAFSGRTVVQPLPRCVTGVGDWFAPPVSARGFKLTTALVVDGHRVIDNGNRGKGDCGLLWAGGTWLPDRIERHGTYHHALPIGVRSLAVRSELVPLASAPGFVLTITVTNRGVTTVDCAWEIQVEPGGVRLVPLNEWDYSPPPVAALPAHANGEGRWQGEGVSLTLHREGTRAAIAPGASVSFRLAVADSAAVPPTAGLAAWAAETATVWERRLALVASRFPSLSGGTPELRAYWQRCLFSFLLCWWEAPGFCHTPFIATSGLDGGAICAYPWDVGGYAPQAVAQILGPSVLGVLDGFLGFGLDSHSRYTPAGNGTNVDYSYNAFSAVALAWGAACHQGLDRARFRTLAEQVLAIDAGRTNDGELVDWGVQHNLLEMRQRGWEYLVASPNAERAWCFDRLADLADFIGEPGAAAWRAQAERIRSAVVTRLWDDDQQWFRCCHPDGGIEHVLSIQAFDAWRVLPANPRIDAGLLHHLQHSGFLGEYGVSSIGSADTIHYELNDPDWSGGGAYSGDGPLLALTLWEKGRGDLAWDVLKRHFWMGKQLAYIPQEHCCDRPEVPAHKRSNIVAGIAGCEAVIGGIFGLMPHPDGSLRWQPAAIPSGEPVRLEGYRFRGHEVTVEVSATGSRAWVDGVAVSGQQLVAPLPRTQAAVSA